MPDILSLVHHTLSPPSVVAQVRAEEGLDYSTVIFLLGIAWFRTILAGTANLQLPTYHNVLEQLS